MKQESFLESLRRAGLDADAALMRLNGNFSLYLQVLRRFREEDAEAMARICELIDKGNPQEARILVHALRGSTGILGAGPLSDALRRLEMDLVRIFEEGGCLEDRLLEEVRERWRALQEHLAPMDFSMDGEKEQEQICFFDEQEWIKQLDNLQEYIELHQPCDCLDLLELLIAAAPDEELKNGLNDMGSSIRGYRFDDALESIKKILNAKRTQ